MIAKSTIAMSAVSLLATSGARSRIELEQNLVDYYQIEPAKVSEAITDALIRGLVVPLGGRLCSILPAGYAVRDRDRRGDGWDDWTATNGAGHKIVVADLMKGGS